MQKPLFRSWRKTTKSQPPYLAPLQLALAWVLAQGPDVVPIPGTRSRSRLEENAGAPEIDLSDHELAEIEELIPRDMAAGTRYPEQAMSMLNG